VRTEDGFLFFHVFSIHGSGNDLDDDNTFENLGDSELLRDFKVSEGLLKPESWYGAVS
jgi:hypothetical protein